MNKKHKHRATVWINKNKKRKVNCSEFVEVMQNITSTNFNQSKDHASWYYKLKEKYDIFEDEQTERVENRTGYL